jgi:hypothetical protein
MTADAGTTALPAPFRDLEHYVGEWALADEIDRYRKRHTSTFAAASEFYRAIQPRMAAIAAHLDTMDLDRLPPDCERLLHLGLMCQELFPAVELFKDVHVPQTYPWDKFYVTSPRKARPPSAEEE